MNWTYPVLLTAHLRLGAVCAASSASKNESVERDRTPVLPLLLALLLLGSAVFVRLAAANVAVRRSSDSTLVTGTTTDSTGHFAIEDVPLGEYVVVASFVGFEPWSQRITLTASNPVRTFSRIRLEAAQGQMQEATVSAERPFVTTEGSKKVYSFEQSQVALAGKSAVDVLQDLPSLRIDEIEGAIQLRGNQSVSIHVNGEPVSMEDKALVQYLKGLSAEDIERVEVNTNPSARYDAEGTAGIINIVLGRKEDDGLSGGGSVAVGIGPRIEGSGNLGYQQGQWTLYGSYSYTYHGHEFARNLTRRSAEGASTLLLQRSSDQQHSHGGHTFNAEIEYALTPATTLSLTSTGTVRGGEQTQSMTSRREPTGPPRTREVEGDNRSVHLDERLSVNRTFAEEDHTLSTDLRYQRDEDRDRIREVQVASFPRERETETEDEHEATFKLDYTRPLSEWTIETGYKGAVRILDQDYEVRRFDAGAGHVSDTPDQTDVLTFREQVHAGYGTLERSFGPLDAEVGLRAEHTRMRTDPQGQSSEDNQYTDLFPSASLTYELGQGRRVSLSYSKRINRPNTYQLSAFNASGDPYVRFRGNPNLEPETVHKTELTVMQKIGSAMITVSPYARRKTNAIERTALRNDSVTVRTYDNYDTRASYGTELTSSLQFGKDLKATLSGNIFGRRTRGGTLAGGTTRNAFAVMQRANVTWTLREDLRLQVSQMYRSPMTAGVGRMGSFVRTGASLEKTFWNEKGTLGLEVEDPFNTSKIKVRTRRSDFHEKRIRDWDGRTVSFSFSYRFGDSDQKKRRGASSGRGLSPADGG